MSSMENPDSRGTYSWWWDSHIVPKHSKWLQLSLADMDDKIVEMLDLIKEDGDSFAMRAQMFYQRKPKLGELIEQIYRAYRALAERYDHASGALHQVRDSVSKDSDASNLLDTETNELDVENFINEISNLQQSVSQSEIEIENLKQCLGRAEAERDDAVDRYKVVGSEVERLQVAVIETRQEKEDVEAALKKLQNLHRNSAKQLRVSNSENQLRPEVIDDLDDKIKNSKEVTGSPIPSKLKDQNLRLRDIAKNLEADIEHHVKYQNSLHQEIDRLKIEADEAKEKLMVFEQLQQSLVSEKALLVSRLETADDANWKLELKCSEFKNALLDSNSKLEAFRNRAKGLEASWPILLHDKFSLIAEKEALEGRCKELENNREDLNGKKPQLLLDIDEERRQHSAIVSDMEIQILQLKNTVQDLEKRSSILSTERWSLIEVCGSFEKRLLDLENEIQNCESKLKSLSGELDDQTLESSIERSVIYSVLAQIGERLNILEKQNVRVSLELRKLVAEREKESAFLVQNMVLGSIRESLLEYQMKELIEAYHISGESKATEIELLHERIDLLEGQNVRLSSVLASGYITAEEASFHEYHDLDIVEKKVAGDEPENMGRSPTQGMEHRGQDHEKILHTKNGSRTNDSVISECEATDDRMLELWETSNGGSTIDLKVGIRSNHRRLSDCNSSRECPCPSEKVPEESSSLMEVSEKKTSRRRSGRLILDRLVIDLQKLTNLQITLKDLKRNVNSSQYRCDEYDNVKEQLEAVEVDIMSLLDTNQKLTKSMQKAVMSSDVDSNGSDSLRGVSEQVCKIGEAIGRQQRKLQSIQWLLLKIDEENKRSSAGGTRIINVWEPKPKVLLKDVLHVRVKKKLKKKKDLHRSLSTGSIHGNDEVDKDVDFYGSFKHHTEGLSPWPWKWKAGEGRDCTKCRFPNFRHLGLEYDKVFPSIGKVAQFNADQLLTDCPYVSALVRESRDKEFNIILDDVAITHQSYGAEFSRAVKQKQVAQQEAERSKFVGMKADQERRAAIRRVEGESESAKLISDATAAMGMGLIELRRIAATLSKREEVLKRDRKGKIVIE